MKKTNRLAIIGFVLSFFGFLSSTIVCIIGLGQIKESNEKGRGLALAGLLISLAKIGLVILAFILFATHDFNYTENLEEKCKRASNCVFDVETNSYTCSIINGEGVEEYFQCATNPETNESVNDNLYDDYEDMDTTDYDKEN